MFRHYWLLQESVTVVQWEQVSNFVTLSRCHGLGAGFSQTYQVRLGVDEGGTSLEEPGVLLPVKGKLIKEMFNDSSLTSSLVPRPSSDV